MAAHLQDVEKIRPSAIIDIIHSGEQLSVQDKVTYGSAIPKQWKRLELALQSTVKNVLCVG